MQGGMRMSALARLSGAMMHNLRPAAAMQSRSTATQGFAVNVNAVSAEDAEAPAAVEKPAEKRPRSAYITFVSDMYADIAAANPEKKGKDVMTQLGVEWKKLPEQEKAEYKKKMETAQAAWDQKYPAGIPKTTPAKREKKVKEPKPATPKRMPNAYNLFVAQRLPALRKPNQAASEAMQMVAKEWQTLSQGEKDQWKEKAATAVPQ
eukprot:CAMPEP_0206134704 /NCGR_PEP_ID=MMETSP1473-20131121/164_1 /ASSEMBLY_ACC=CAM_ASM_001109 /TAXON_ID=1461547 /ORGANISM="Stichococcus sp, Strain RCC1054" /LENGTH=205 /DNA_ID=CAMNT_0053526323 /DNA_START=184 /DNA_END=801 /DNA_ORIENTATION=+